MVTSANAQAIRLHLGLSIRPMAAALGVHRRTIENAETRGATGSLAAVYQLVAAHAVGAAIARVKLGKRAKMARPD